MNGIAFRLFGINIYWYGIMILCGVVAGAYTAMRLSRKLGYNSDMVTDFLLLALPLGIIGARLYDVAFEWDYFSHHLNEIFSLQMQGLAIYGAVIGGVIAVLILCKWRKMSPWDVLDVAVPGLILAQAIGRWGNYFNQELYGALLTDVSGKILPDLALFPPAVMVNGQWYVALFLMESVWNLCVFGLLLMIWKKKPDVRGLPFWSYLALYCSVRTVLEGMRQSEFSLMVFDTIRVSQLVSAVVAVIAIGGVIWTIKKGGYARKPVPKCYALPSKYDSEQGEEPPPAPGKDD